MRLLIFNRVTQRSVNAVLRIQDVNPGVLIPSPMTIASFLSSHAISQVGDEEGPSQAGPVPAPPSSELLQGAWMTSF